MTPYDYKLIVPSHHLFINFSSYEVISLHELEGNGVLHVFELAWISVRRCTCNCQFRTCQNNCRFYDRHQRRATAWRRLGRRQKFVSLMMTLSHCLVLCLIFPNVCTSAITQLSHAIEIPSRGTQHHEDDRRHGELTQVHICTLLIFLSNYYLCKCP